MSANRGLIQNDKYFTQVGQLRRMEKTAFGDFNETSVVTVACLVYHEQQRVNQSAPAVSQNIEHFACISSSWAVVEGDHLTAVVDRFGETFLADSRIVKITKYGDWRHGNRFVKLDLDLQLG